ncbi:sterol O-acyltransferase, partial [Tremellales sp. Uapishka_1]
MSTTLSKGSEAVIPTPSGVIHVRPYRSSSSAQLRAMLSFTPRVSPLDRHNAKSQVDEFRGFFTLFWIGLALLFLRTSAQSWEENRQILSPAFGRLITRDALVLAISDGIMVLTSVLCVPFVKALQYRYFSYYYTGLVLQHMFQTAYLGLAVWWGYHRQWYWVQSGFLCLHALSMLMKMHSYMAHNGMLATVFFRLQNEKGQLSQLLKTLPGGEEAVLREATARHAQLEAEQTTPIGTPGTNTPALATPANFTDGSTGYNEPLEGKLGNLGSISVKEGTPEPDMLRHRGKKIHKKPSSQAIDSLPAPQANLPLGTSLEPSHTTTPHVPRVPNPLAWSSEEEVAVLARNIDAMEDELRSNGPKGLVWPQNVSYFHFFDYLLIPTLVYQLEYPRTKTMRPLYVFEKILATFGTFSLIYTITEHYIMPLTPKPGDSLIKSFINLCLPMMINYLLFADREFYQDWWNSTSWDQFSRKWNKPVHTFLLRHVYASTMSGLQLSRASATFITFLLSALCHELVMAVVTKKIRPYLFLMQMAQLPMILVGRLPIIKRNKTVGNIVFWIGLMAGFPLL